jgi:SnoaL-like domain
MFSKTLLAASAIATLSTLAEAKQNAATKLPPAGAPEVSRVISVVSSIPLAVDLADYALAERAFAPKVVIDYTSLWGGTPNTTTPAELMIAWRGIVPGFDATWHELSDVTAKVNGEKATATAYVDGRHWIGAQIWRPVGRYNWDLEKLNGQWKVTRMQFAMTQEIGSRDLATKAMERAKAANAGQTK